MGLEDRLEATARRVTPAVPGRPWDQAILALAVLGPAAALGAVLGIAADALLPGVSGLPAAGAGAGVGLVLGVVWYVTVGRRWLADDGPATVVAIGEPLRSGEPRRTVAVEGVSAAVLGASPFSRRRSRTYRRRSAPVE